MSKINTLQANSSGKSAKQICRRFVVAQATERPPSTSAYASDWEQYNEPGQVAGVVSKDIYIKILWHWGKWLQADGCKTWIVLIYK